MSYTKIHPLTVVMKGKISYIDQNNFLHQAVNMFFSAVKLGILTWGVYEIDSLLQPASSGQSMNCSFSHFRVGFTRESGRLPLGLHTASKTFIRHKKKYKKMDQVQFSAFSHP